MIEYRCTQCHGEMSSPSSLAGQKDSCPLCGQIVLVPIPLDFLPQTSIHTETPSEDDFDPLEVLFAEEEEQSSIGNLYCYCPNCRDLQQIHDSDLGTHKRCEECGNVWLLPRSASARTIHTQLVGVTHRNADGTNRQDVIRGCMVGQTLLMRRQPEHPIDPNTVILQTDHSGIVGCLSQEIATEFSQYIADGGPFRAVVTHMPTNISGKKVRGINVEITRFNKL